MADNDMANNVHLKSSDFLIGPNSESLSRYGTLPSDSSNVSQGDAKPCVTVTDHPNEPNSGSLQTIGEAFSSDTKAEQGDVKPCITDLVNEPNSGSFQTFDEAFSSDTKAKQGDVKPCITDLLNEPNSGSFQTFDEAFSSNTKAGQGDVKPCITDLLNRSNSESLEKYEALRNDSDSDVTQYDIKPCVTDCFNQLNSGPLQSYEAFSNDTTSVAQGDIKPCNTDLIISTNSEPRQIHKDKEFPYERTAGNNDVKDSVTDFAYLSSSESAQIQQSGQTPVPTHLVENTVRQSVSGVTSSTCTHNTTACKCKEDGDCRGAKGMKLGEIKSYTLQPVSDDLNQSNIDQFVSELLKDIADSTSCFSTQVTDHAGESHTKSDGHSIELEQNNQLRPCVKTRKAKEYQGKIPVEVIDLTAINKFRWEWLSLKDNLGDFFSSYIKKLEKDGFAWCCYCKTEIKYSGGGVSCLKCHAKTKSHKLKRDIEISNQRHPAAMQATQNRIDETFPASSSSSTRLPLPHEAAPNLDSLGLAREDSTVPTGPVPVSLKDRVSHQEALLCSFMAQHTLPLTMAPHLIELAQELAKDQKSLAQMHMETQMATYKLRFGLSELEHTRLVKVLRNRPFSLNIDESTPEGSKERILNILVCYYCENLKKSVCELYASIEMTVVNAETVFEAVRNQFLKDQIPFTNLISVLSDSAAYMKGSLNGLQAKLKKVAPHIIDIDGNVCLHIHNAAKKFTTILDSNGMLIRLLDDLFNDFDRSSDLRDDLKEICRLMELPEHTPIQRAGHRWMSVYDASLRLLEIKEALTIFYSAWLTVEEKKEQQPKISALLKNVKKDSKTRIIVILQRLRHKKLAQADRERKRRVVSKLFMKSQESFLLANTIVSILPLLKNFILTFEQKEPMVHRLYDGAVLVFKTFLTCFLTHEYVNVFSRNIKKIDIDSDKIHPLKRIYVGDAAQKILSGIGDQKAKAFRKTVLSAFRETGKYLKCKPPINNKNLALLSAIDPDLCGRSRASSGFQDLFDLLPTIVRPEEKDGFSRAASTLQSDTKFVSSIKEKKLDRWWTKVISQPQYEVLGQVIKACLSIFTGRRVESSFSVMNNYNIVTGTSNRSDVGTYEAIYKIKYKFLNCEKSCTEYFHREDPAHSPIDSSLCYYMQTAGKRMKTQKESPVQGTASKFKKLSAHQRRANDVRAAIIIHSRATDSTPATQEDENPRPSLKRKIPNSDSDVSISSSCDRRIQQKMLKILRR